MIDLKTLIEMVLNRMNEIDLDFDPANDGYLRYARGVRDHANSLLPTITDVQFMIPVMSINEYFDLPLDKEDLHTYFYMFRQMHMMLLQMELKLDKQTN